MNNKYSKLQKKLMKTAYKGQTDLSDIAIVSSMTGVIILYDYFYLEDKDTFKRVCEYIKKATKITGITLVGRVCLSVGLFLKNNSIVELEKIDEVDFLSDYVYKFNKESEELQ